MSIFCDECKKNIATVFLTKVSGEEVSKVQLCEACSKKMEETSEAVNLFAFLPQILTGFSGQPEDAADDILTGALVKCDSCGTSFNDFQKMGFLGCPDCYRALGEPLERVIMDFQGSTGHKGKMPSRVSEDAKLRRRLIDLEQNLERQIIEEDYEAAASVRDKIREIREKLYPGVDEYE
ncbi:MAG: hypothetical protein JXA49_05230 [Actinobacteria bacterium]|nr:hypothetical protein [Actinomycetota bacterium]